MQSQLIMFLVHIFVFWTNLCVFRSGMPKSPQHSKTFYFCSKKVSLSLPSSYNTTVVIIAIIIIYDSVMIMKNDKAPSGS